MNPRELRQAREDLGWSRAELAVRSGLSRYQVDTIETGRRAPRDDEIEALRTVLLTQLNELIATGETPITVVEGSDEDVDGWTHTHGLADVVPSDVERLTEWNGVRRGDHVRVKDLRGDFRFLYYHRDAWGEYVELYGPTGNPKERSITVDRIVLPR